MNSFPITTRPLWTYVLFVFLAFSLSSNSLRAQCPPVEPGCGAWIPLSKTINFGDCQMAINGQYRLCGAVLQYQVFGYTLTGTGCNFWKDSSLQQLADVFMIGQANKDAALNIPGYSVPYCPTQVQQVEFFVSSCYIWQKCTYETTSAPPICDPLENNPGPAPNNHVDVWTWHPCGVSCCKRTYQVCIDPGVYNPESWPADLNGVHVTLISKQRVIPCTDNANGKWTSRDCNDGC